MPASKGAIPTGPWQEWAWDRHQQHPPHYIMDSRVRTGLGAQRGPLSQVGKLGLKLPPQHLGVQFLGVQWTDACTSAPHPTKGKHEHSIALCGPPKGLTYQCCGLLFPHPADPGKWKPRGLCSGPAGTTCLIERTIQAEHPPR